MRNDSEYPDFDTPQITADDVDAASAAAGLMVDLAARLVGTLPPYRR